MRIAVVSCWKYRDAWVPFLRLFRKFWSNCEFTPEIISDTEEYPRSWCEVVTEFAKAQTDPILLLQEDFFLNAPVDEVLVAHALYLLHMRNLGAIRLYPCPGATDLADNAYFGPVSRNTEYRNSLQATIWRPAYLAAIAERYKTPSEFELEGSAWASENLPGEVWAFKREVQPWPISYICSAISRGKWEPAALELCKQHGIEVDLTLRPVVA